jgi:predicted benzoate:H+ symporter BenE
MRWAALAALPLALVALALVAIAGLSILPYHVHAHHPVALVLTLSGLAAALLVVAYICLHAPERAFRRWREHSAFDRKAEATLRNYVAGGKRTRGEN